MFARTQRLLLRPGFPEDALLLAALPGEQQASVAPARDRLLPSMLIIERTQGSPRLVGVCGLGRRPSGRVEIGCWITPGERGRGLATEAATALIGIARALRLRAIEGSHFLDDPASGRLLSKLGFASTGLVASRTRTDGTKAQARVMRLELGSEPQSSEEPLAA